MLKILNFWAGFRFRKRVSYEKQLEMVPKMLHFLNFGQESALESFSLFERFWKNFHRATEPNRIEVQGKYRKVLKIKI